MKADRLRAGTWVLALVAAQAAVADPPQFTTEAGLGTESQSSPLFQISPVGTPVYLDGLQRYRSDYAQAAAQLSWEGSLPAGLHGSLSASAMLKRAPGKSDFDYAMTSAQPSVHGTLAGVNVGFGPTWTHLDVAHQFGRSAVGWQASAAWVRDDDLVSFVAERVRQQHTAQWSEMDATATTAVLQWQRKRPFSGPDAGPFAGIEALQLTAFAGRESNRHGFDELSYRNGALQAGLDWTGWGLGWSVLGTWQQSRFDASAFDGEAPRRDRGWSLDASAQWSLSSDLKLLVAAGGGSVRSTTHLYDYRHGHASVTLQRHW